MSKRQTGTHSSQSRNWPRLIRSWHRSRLTVRQFCRRQGITESSFYYWRRKLKATEASAPAASRSRMACQSVRHVPSPASAAQSHNSHTCAQAPAADFIELVLPEDDPALTAELLFSAGGHLKFPSDIKPQSLRQILAVLQELKLC